MPKINLKVTGADEIISSLRSLSENTLSQVVWPAAVEAASVIRDAAIENAHAYVDDPATRQYIPANIVMRRRIKRGKEEGAAIVSVGVLRGMAGTGNNTWYWWWLELGSRYTRPRSYLRKAAFHNIDKVFSTFYLTADYELSQLVKNITTYRSGKFPNIKASTVVNGD